MLVSRDPNIAATITSVSLGMVLAGVANDAKPETMAREVMVAVNQLNNDISKHQEELHIHKQQTEGRLEVKRDTIATEEVIQEEKISKPSSPDISDNGQSSIVTLIETLTEETPELCEMVSLPRFVWEEISASSLGTGIAPPNVMLCKFKKSQMALAA